MNFVRILITICLVVIAQIAFAQHIYKIKTDSLLVTNDSCTAELNLENKTKNVDGFLYNKGNGRTEFRKPLIKIDSTHYLMGKDTLTLSSSAGIQALNGLTKSNDSIMLGGDLFTNTNVNMNNNSLSFVNGNKGYNNFRLSFYRDTITSANNLYVQNHFTGNIITSTVGPGSIYAETFWNQSQYNGGLPVTSGWFPNYVSRHKSTVAGTNMAGTFIIGFASYFQSSAGQTFGKLADFYATPVFSNSGTISNRYGLLLESLKGPGTQNSYAIYSAGTEDSVYNAGPVRWTKYLNNANEDSVLTTDQYGRIKLKGAFALNENSRISNLSFLAGRDTVLTYDSTTKQIKTTRIINSASQGNVIGRISAGNGPLELVSVPIVLASGSVSNVSSLDIDLSAWYINYNEIEIKIANIRPANNNVELRMRLSSDGTNYDAGTGNYKWGYSYVGASLGGGSANNASETFIKVGLSFGNSTAMSGNVKTTISNPSSSTFYPLITGDVVRINYDGDMFKATFGGSRTNAQITRGVRFFFSAGNISTATYKVIGIKN